MARIEAEGADGLDRIVETSAANAAVSGTGLTKSRLITGANGLPESQGLFDVSHTRDSCGVGFVAHMKGVKSHAIVHDALQVLENLEHRGAAGADPLMGDGAGILMQIPHAFFAREAESLASRYRPPDTTALAC